MPSPLYISFDIASQTSQPARKGGRFARHLSKRAGELKRVKGECVYGNLHHRPCHPLRRRRPLWHAVRKGLRPDDRATPAYAKQDGVDYVPMRGWKNSLINLLNIAGTGPIIGPIQGILFGPIAFITIPIGNVIGGAMHDYFSGMICLRDGGTQMPDMVRKYSNKGVFTVYQIFLSVLLLLVGAVFIYTPGDIAATQVFGFDGAATSVSTWVIYGVIFVYYLIATVFPIDAIIGRIYPIFGAILLLSAVGVFIGMFVKGYPLLNLWDNWQSATFNYGEYFTAQHFIPVFFITVACGILSGFHSTQTAIISRTMKSERQGRMTFYNMMVLEGLPSP